MTLFYFFPELFLIFSLLCLLMYGVVYSTSKKYAYPIVINSHIWLSILTYILCFLLFHSNSEESISIFFQSLTIDEYTTQLKMVLLFSLICISFLSFGFIKKEKINSFEYISLIMLSVLGMLLIISSSNLLMLFLSLEVQALSFYLLTSYQRTNERSIEAGLKYFIFGAFSSGILLFGSSLLYGTTGLFYFEDFPILLSNFALGEHIPVNLFFLSLLFIFMGFLFKLYAVPFHVWVPDIYEGSPTHITALFATAPVLAIFGIFARLTNVTFYDLIPYWNSLFVFCCILSMVVGCLASIYQKKIKRLIAYSSIGHVGFFLLGISVGTPEGTQASFFYVFGYIIMTVCFFAVLLSLRKKQDGQLIENLKDFHLFYKINPMLAFSMAMVLFSMAGIPPLLGFFSKFYIFLNASEHSLYVFLVIGVITSAISSFYCLNCIKIIYFESSKEWTLFDQVEKSNAIIIGISFFALVFFFLHPSFLVALSYKVSFSLLV